MELANWNNRPSISYNYSYRSDIMADQIVFWSNKSMKWSENVWCLAVTYIFPTLKHYYFVWTWACRVLISYLWWTSNFSHATYSKIIWSCLVQKSTYIFCILVKILLFMPSVMYVHRMCMYSGSTPSVSFNSKLMQHKILNGVYNYYLLYAADNSPHVFYGSFFTVTNQHKT